MKSSGIYGVTKETLDCIILGHPWYPKTMQSGMWQMHSGTSYLKTSLYFKAKLWQLGNEKEGARNLSFHSAHTFRGQATLGWQPLGIWGQASCTNSPRWKHVWEGWSLTVNTKQASVKASRLSWVVHHLLLPKGTQIWQWWWWTQHKNIDRQAHSKCPSSHGYCHEGLQLRGEVIGIWQFTLLKP